MAKAVEETELIGAKQPADLFGEFRFKVDAKGRVALPAKFRKVLSRELVVSRELQDECIYVFEPESFNDWVNQLFEDKFGGYNASDRDHVLLRSALKSRADSVEVDSAGRISLNMLAREACGIDKDVVIVGNTGYFEIWDAEAYEDGIQSIDLGMFYDKSDAPKLKRTKKKKEADLRLSVGR